MSSFREIDFALIVSIVALIVSIAALFATFLSIRYQIVARIDTQLADKARECNANLNLRGEVTSQADKISGIVSSIITAKQLLNYQLKNKRIRILLISKQPFIDQFYLQLNTSIRVWIEKNTLTESEIVTVETGEIDIRNENNQIKKKIIFQFQEAKEFLKKSIERNQKEYFDNI